MTSLPLTIYRSRSCADVLRGERADVTDFFSRDLDGWFRGQAKYANNNNNKEMALHCMILVRP